MKRIALCVLAIVSGIVLPIVGLGLGLGATLVQATAQTEPSALADSDLPPVVIRADVDAAERCIGLPWQLLAAVNLTADPSFVAHLDRQTGEISPPFYGASVAAGDTTSGSSRSLGPMAFAPTTWAAAATVYPGGVGGGAPDPQNEYDAIFTLADVLCALRVSNGDLEDTLAAYDGSPSSVQATWALAIDLGMNADGTTGRTGTSSSSSGAPSGSTPPASGVTYPISLPPGMTYPGSGTALVAAAEAELGVPYVWGGITAHVGLDCSGLVVVSMQAIGFNLLWSFRTSQEQATLGTTVPVNELRPGDLLFFVGDDTTGPTVLGHVAIYVGGGEMIQAPETGEVVSFSPVPWDAIEIARRVLK